MVWDDKGGPCHFRKPVVGNTTTDSSTNRSTDGPCQYSEQGKNKPTATDQDILNLATAYAVIQRNKSLGGGYELSKVYRGGILNALEKTTGKYCEQFAENKETTNK